MARIDFERGDLEDSFDIEAGLMDDFFEMWTYSSSSRRRGAKKRLKQPFR